MTTLTSRPGATRALVRRAPRGDSRLTVWGGRVLFFALLILVWHLAATGTALRSSLSSPWDTTSAFVKLLLLPGFWLDVFYTLRSSLLGLLLAAVVGILLGLLIGASKFLYSSTAFTIDFLRTIPGLAVIPLGILVFGPSMKLDIFMIVFSALWPIIIQTTYAAHSISREILEMASVYRLSTSRRLFFVFLPACLPGIGTGLRLAATMSLLLAVGTQLLTGSPGIGSRITGYQEAAAYDLLYACILLAGVLGIAFNGGIRALEKKLLGWHYTPRELERRA